MKKLLFTFIFLISLNVFPQFNSDSTILIVHGAWGGGWSFKKVDIIDDEDSININSNSQKENNIKEKVLIIMGNDTIINIQKNKK